MKKKCDILVIGSGPAGLAAAYAGAKSSARVILLEKMPACSRKLLASGGGRCNVSNRLPLEEFASAFGGVNWRFLLPALSGFHGDALMDFFAENSVPLHLEDGFHYFPTSGKASDIRDLFIKQIRSFGGEIFCGTEVVSIRQNEGYWDVSSADGRAFLCRKVICACGGMGYPALGGGKSGYLLAESTGHRVTELYPGMTGVVCENENVRRCVGISLSDCAVRIGVKKLKNASDRGELLFTHRGFSAFAVMDLAASFAELLKKYDTVPMHIDFLPEMTRESLQKIFASWRRDGGKKHISSLLGEFFPKKVADLLLGGNDPEISRWTAGASDSLAENIKNSIFQISAVESWEKAMVTRGGVSLKDVFPETLESRLCKGLFFVGEMLDVDGPCGGFNINWALASGMRAGMSAAAK